MALSGKAVDKSLFALLYAGLIALTIWGGCNLINYSLDLKFCRDFLLKWDVALRSYSAKNEIWPYFSGSNHVEYMENLVRSMRNNSLSPPASNTERPYVYRFKKIGRSEEDIFLLCFPDRIILYGIPENMFTKIDRFIDNKAGKDDGMFRGYPGKDGRTYIGLWRL